MRLVPRNDAVLDAQSITEHSIAILGRAAAGASDLPGWPRHALGLNLLLHIQDIRHRRRMDVTEDRWLAVRLRADRHIEPIAFVIGYLDDAAIDLHYFANVLC